MSICKNFEKAASVETIFNPWCGKFCTQAEKTDVAHQWVFTFGERGVLLVECLWRIIANGTIALTEEDDGQIFGLPSPVNAGEKALELLSQKAVAKIITANETGDLYIYFEGNVRLEILNNSSGYEGWHAVVKNAGETREIVAQGGGQLSMWPS